MMARRFAACLLACTAIAQGEPSPNRFVPADANIVLRIGGPAAWRQAFGGTKLGKLFDGPSLRPFVTRLRDQWEPMLQQAAAAGMAPEVLDALAKDYRGEWIVSFRIDLEQAFAAPDDEEPVFAAMIVMTPDGAFDLPGLLASFRKLDEPVERELEALQIGEHTFRAVKRERQVTQVELIDGHLVMFVGNAIERFGEQMLATTDRAETLPVKAPLSVHVDLAPVVTTLIDRATAEAGEDSPVPIRRAFELLGFANLGAFSLTCGATDDHVAVETCLTMRGGDNGLLDMLLVERGKSTLLRWLPAGTDAFQLTAFDVNALYRTIARLFDLAGERAVVSLADVERNFAEKTKVRLREDLLDHVGQELMVLGSFRDVIDAVAEAAEGGKRPDPGRLFGGYCVALQLRNGKAFAASVDTMVRAVGLHAACKTEEYGSARIHTLRLAGVFAIEFAIADDCLLLAPGSRGAGSIALRAALDARASGDAALHDAVAARLEGLADGWSGLGLTPVVDFLTSALDYGVQLRPRPDSKDLRAGWQTIAAELKGLGLGDIVDVTWTSPKGFRTVYRW